MQFFKSAVFFVVAFAAAALAAPQVEGSPNPGPNCKPLLQSCAVNSECCGDLCVLGVSVVNMTDLSGALIKAFASSALRVDTFLTTAHAYDPIACVR